MSAHTATAVKSAQKAQRELEDLQLVMKARNGKPALDALMRRYTGFVRLKASSYFLRRRRRGRPGPGGADRSLQGGARLPSRQGDVVPELRRALRDRQIITAIKTATRFKHQPLNQYISFSHTPAGQDSEGECTLGDAPRARRRTTRPSA